MSRPGLVVFSDDWGRHPSSCQHLVSHLLDDFAVTWVNTIGMRTLKLDRATLARGAEKLGQWFGGRPRPAPGADADAGGPRVLNPRMWPGFGSAASRRLNRELLERALSRHVPRLESQVLLTTIPIVADLVGRIPARRWVYYCVDDFSVWPGLDGETLRSMEAALVASVDEVIAAGENLATHLRALGREPKILAHGVDLERWAGRDAGTTAPRLLKGIERPLVLFWGLIDQRLDIEWLSRLAERLPGGTIGLVGPQQAPDVALARLPRVELLGPVPFEQLPSWAACADVLVMPYRDMPVTRAMQPLKLKEYLATGKPVVVRRLPGTVAWEDCLYAVDSADAFAAAVLEALSAGVPASQREARRRLEAERWSGKAGQLRQWLLEEGSP